MDLRSGELKYSNNVLENLKNKFQENGFVIIKKDYTLPNCIIEGLKKEIDYLFHIEGWRGGWEGKEEYMEENKFMNNGAKRLANLIEKSDIFINLISIEIIEKFCESIFKKGYFIGGLDAREPLEGFGEQPFHQDWFPNDDPDNVDNMIGFFFLDNSNKENGTLRVVPKTHKKKGWVSEYMENTKLPHPDQIFINAKKGDILMMNGSLWHSGSKNINGKRNRMIFIDFRSKDIPQLLNQKRYLSQKTVANLPKKIKEILKVTNKDELGDYKTFTTGDYCRKNNIFWPKG